MSKHTPGKWQKGPALMRMMSHAITAPSKQNPLLRVIVAHVEQQNDRDTGDAEDAANASLIEAAPEMLDALRRISNCEYLTDEVGDLALIDALIAKAEGRS